MLLAKCRTFLGIMKRKNRMFVWKFWRQGKLTQCDTIIVQLHLRIFRSKMNAGSYILFSSLLSCFRPWKLSEYNGAIIELGQERRGILKDIKYLTPTRSTIVYELPLAEVITDFFDQVCNQKRASFCTSTVAKPLTHCSRPPHSLFAILPAVKKPYKRICIHGV